MNRVKAVLLTEYLGRVFRCRGLSPARDREQHRGAAADELEGILIARDQHAGIPALVRLSAQRAEQVIRFKARLFHARDPHCVEHLADERQLLCQLVRHTLSRALIGFIFFMAECFFPDVKADDDAIRCMLAL